jgi:leader peptidase (prepilin peptidase)/N-methyltransferase
MSTAQLVAALGAAALAAALALSGPRVLTALPEPAEPTEDKRSYAELGARPGLGLRLGATAAFAAAAVALALGANAVVLVWAYVCALGVLLAYVDWSTRLLPFWLVAPSYAVVALLTGLAALVEADLDVLLRAGVGWLASFALFFLMWLVYSKGLGYGDVRLSGLLGMALGGVGWQELMVGTYAAFLFGAVGGGVLTLARKVDRRAYPFGPFMVLGAWFGVVSGPWLTGWFG